MFSRKYKTALEMIATFLILTILLILFKPLLKQDHRIGGKPNDCTQMEEKVGDTWYTLTELQAATAAMLEVEIYDDEQIYIGEVLFKKIGESQYGGLTPENMKVVIIPDDENKGVLYVKYEGLNPKKFECKERP